MKTIPMIITGLLLAGLALCGWQVVKLKQEQQTQRVQLDAVANLCATNAWDIDLHTRSLTTLAKNQTGTSSNLADTVQILADMNGQMLDLQKECARQARFNEGLAQLLRGQARSANK